MAMFMHVRERKLYRERRHVSDKQLLRFEDESINFLTAEFLPESDETRGGALTPRGKMEIFLRAVADPGFQIGVAEDVGVDRSTVCKTFHYVMDCITDRAHHWIKFPNSVRKINDAQLLWQTRFRLPSVIGALDCTQIEILKPRLFGDEYVCRKGYPSINVQATGDATEQFTSICAEWPGSVHDSRIWRNSQVREVIARYDGAACLLGDSGYGISPWLITPFKPPRNQDEIQFNRLHAQERVIVERVFGQVKKGFL
ncbi:putative nuclease HARBI1 [Homalodisca vitripennis]|uniref:putative nuclease HARBI1 n=1 Tax=Homalodisca vitripennis TaxID=197043 RepID=UPI001EEA9CC9|nr:putative nuclease HARBI1 [Homalodisca vitripennis]